MRTGFFGSHEEKIIDTLWHLFLLVGILTLVCLFRQGSRINRLEEMVELTWRRSKTAEYEAHAAWFTVQVVLRGLATGFPPEQWRTVMEEVRNGAIQSSDGERDPERSWRGPGGAVTETETRPAEGDDQ
jgi:hypothetical protein